MSKKILVTGGAGYIGSHTCVELAKAGYEPVIIDDFSNSEPFMADRINELTGKQITLYEGDCADAGLLKSIFSEHRDVAGVIHFAAFKAVGESSAKPLKYYENNLMTTIRLLEAMQEHGVSGLVFSSSCTVYGQPDVLPVTEETPLKPAESPYGRSKQICEDIISDFIKSGASVKAISLRYFNPIGAHPSGRIGELPRGVPNNLVPYLTQTAAGLREKLTVFGNDYDTPDGTCIRDYIHVADLAAAHVAAIGYLQNLEHENFYDTFNVGTGNGNSVQEVIDTFTESTGVSLNYEIGPRRPGDVVKTYADVTKISDTLHWKAERSLADGLKDSWNWQKQLSL